jgi:hypothetical protein
MPKIPGNCVLPETLFATLLTSTAVIISPKIAEFFPHAPLFQRRSWSQKALNSLYRGAMLVAVALLIAVSAACRLSAAEQIRLPADLLADGWISLFDGETLFGWQPTSDADWKVENGAVTATSGKEGFLMTDLEYANYELHVEFRAPETTNSGVFLHTPLHPTDPAVDCYELNIAPQDNPFPTGSLVKRKKWASGLLAANLASLPQMIGSADKPEKAGKKNPTKDSEPQATAKAAQSAASPSSPSVVRETDGWHAFDVRMADGDIDICLDGKRLYAYKDESPLRRGHIGLQFREGPVSFRNIRLRPVGLKPMLNGKDLSGWNTDKSESAKFEVVEPQESSGSLPLVGRAGEGGEAGASAAHASAELRVTGGRGQLESNDEYGDFVMQLQCRVDGDGLNSGVFFRSIPHDFWNGYECQINNKIKDNDPTKPADFGTGAIYRRVPARRVVSKDHEWFNMTLAATGPNIAAWVNGYQVTDWTDKRPPHENPRSGLRTRPGTIILQAHDATTNLRFKNLRIAELPK